jgi:hypothetical protein
LPRNRDLRDTSRMPSDGFPVTLHPIFFRRITIPAILTFKSLTIIDQTRFTVIYASAFRTIHNIPDFDTFFRDKKKCAFIISHI